MELMQNHWFWSSPLIKWLRKTCRTIQLNLHWWFVILWTQFFFSLYILFFISRLTDTSFGVQCIEPICSWIERWNEQLKENVYRKAIVCNQNDACVCVCVWNDDVQAPITLNTTIGNECNENDERKIKKKIQKHLI